MVAGRVMGGSWKAGNESREGIKGSGFWKDWDPSQAPERDTSVSLGQGSSDIEEQASHSDMWLEHKISNHRLTVRTSSPVHTGVSESVVAHDERTDQDACVRGW